VEDCGERHGKLRLSMQRVDKAAVAVTAAVLLCVSWVDSVVVYHGPGSQCHAAFCVSSRLLPLRPAGYFRYCPAARTSSSTRLGLAPGRSGFCAVYRDRNRELRLPWEGRRDPTASGIQARRRVKGVLSLQSSSTPLIDEMLATPGMDWDSVSN
jgi:hypothetical protein